MAKKMLADVDIAEMCESEACSISVKAVQIAVADMILNNLESKAMKELLDNPYAWNPGVDDPLT